MSVVFITIPGDVKKKFAQELHKKLEGGIDLIIIQKQRKLPFIHRIQRIHERVGWRRLPKEVWYMTLLRFHRRARHMLDYFREHSPVEFSDSSYPTRVMEVDSVNSDEVHDELKKLSPELMVIWGTAVLKPHIFQTAKKAINLHMGYAPYYRGAVANQQAVFNNDFSKIGATIHYVDEKVDAGNIITTIQADASKPPRELFRELNDRAYGQFLKIATKSVSERYIPTKTQDLSYGQNCLMKHWTYEKRYKLARHIRAWDKRAR